MRGEDKKNFRRGYLPIVVVWLDLDAGRWRPAQLHLCLLGLVQLLLLLLMLMHFLMLDDQTVIQAVVLLLCVVLLILFQLRLFRRKLQRLEGRWRWFVLLLVFFLLVVVLILVEVGRRGKGPSLVRGNRGRVVQGVTTEVC